MTFLTKRVCSTVDPPTVGKNTKVAGSVTTVSDAAEERSRRPHLCLVNPGGTTVDGDHRSRRPHQYGFDLARCPLEVQQAKQSGGA